MGGGGSKEAFKSSITDLINNQQAVANLDDSFWERYWGNASLTTHDYFSLITRQDVHDMMDKASGNLTALCFKLVSRISAATAIGCSGAAEQTAVLNCVRLLTRLLPLLFESPDWRLLFWSPANISERPDQGPPPALAQVLLDSLADLLFCPDFTVLPKVAQGPERPDDLSSLDSSEYIWESGIGCVQSPGTTKQLDNNRAELLKLLLACFSESLYSPPTDPIRNQNRWLNHFTSPANRHVLPLLTSLINVVCTYDPVGYGVPYYYAMVTDLREQLVETCSHVLAVLLDYSPAIPSGHAHSLLPPEEGKSPAVQVQEETGLNNLFVAYMSRLHQADDLEFIIKGLTLLISNPLNQSRTYLPSSTKKIFFTEVLYIILWKLVSVNHKFRSHLLRSPVLFELLVPLLYEMLNSRTDPNMVGMLHVGVFILLVLSGERNFSVRLNKPYASKINMDIPRLSKGTHADLLFLVFHRIITAGLPRIQPLYDCLLTVLVNVSPYLKSLSMVTCTRMIHLVESFSTPWFLFAKPNNHYLVFYLLEIINNIVQYQFDGNTNLVYSVVRSKHVFYQLAGLSENACLTMCRPRSSKSVVGGSEQSSSSSATVEDQLNTAEACSQQQQQPGDGVANDSSPSPPPSPAAAPPTQTMPELKPLKRVAVETVEVDVEPGAGGEDSVPPSPATPQQTTPLQATPTPTTPTSGAPVTTAATPVQPSPHTSSTSATRNSSKPNSSLPLHLVPSSTGATFASSYDLPGPGRTKKQSRPANLQQIKPALYPLGRQVASGNRHLMEPVTPTDFKPTPEWVRSWKQRLPLHTVLRLLQVLVPQVEKMCSENEVRFETEILEYLKNGTLVGLLPVPHPIIIRKYQTSESTEVWFHTYIWGVVYVRNYEPPIWYDTMINLFTVNRNSQ